LHKNCKNPEKPDTELWRKYGLKDNHDGDDDDEDNFEDLTGVEDPVVIP
jgi:hypothetical protein